MEFFAENELDGKVLVAEVKRDRKRADLAVLKGKFETFQQATGLFEKTDHQIKVLSLEDM